MYAFPASGRHNKATGRDNYYGRVQLRELMHPLGPTTREALAARPPSGLSAGGPYTAPSAPALATTPRTIKLGTGFSFRYVPDWADRSNLLGSRFRLRRWKAMQPIAPALISDPHPFQNLSATAARVVLAVPTMGPARRGANSSPGLPSIRQRGAKDLRSNKAHQGMAVGVGAGGRVGTHQIARR
jgi:hypothetical protein